MANTAVLDLTDLAMTFPGLTASREQATPRTRQNRAQSKPGQIKVLIADDSPVYRKIVEQALCAMPFHLIFAANGREAIDLFAKHKPDVVILDRIMPDLTGPETCQTMRSLPQGALAYVIMLTGSTAKASVVEGLEAGADDYVTKPFDDSELMARVRVGLRTRELHRQIEAKNRLLEELALSDPLTGLANRRAVEQWATRELKAAARHGFSFWLAVADLDRFKHVNDTFGHQAGDEVLKRLSRILKANFRESDMCARMGGEEFVMIMTHADRQGALAAVERVRAELELTPFTFNGCTVSVTASFGMAGFGPECHTPTTLNTLLAAADAALYEAKRGGRNRILISAATNA